MAVEDELLEIERELWTGGAEPYRRHLDEECLVAFTEMAGVSGRDRIAQSVRDAERWRDVEIDVRGVLRPLEDLAILTYEASARRGADERYAALVSSAYVRREGAWKMAFHQQTPRPEGTSADGETG